jgi:hypothetical protein
VNETKELLRRGVGDFEPTPDAFDRVLARRDRKRRNQRVAAGVLGIAVFAIAAIGLVRLLGSERGSVIGPATSPSPTASPSPVTQPSPSFTETFDSPLHGLSIGYPSGWRTRAATEPWGGTIAFDAPDVDVIYDPRFRDDLYLAVVSEPIGTTSPEDWVNQSLAVRDRSSLGICQGGGGGGRGHGFQGNPSWFQYAEEPNGALCHFVIFGTATRGYIIYLHVADERHLQTIYKSHWFWGKDGVLSTVELPESAPDASSPSVSS